MEPNSQDEGVFNDEHPVFEPSRGDMLVKLKTPTPNDIYLWRMIVTPLNIKKEWPGKEKIDCEHNDLYWAIDFNKRLITLCADCQNFAYGHKVKENE